MKRILFLFSLTLYVLSCNAMTPERQVRVLETYPHDRDAYTQGLFFHNGQLYETTGLHGKSSIRKVDLKTGKVTRKAAIDSRYFGEGACIVNGKMYVLTWQSRVAFVYDPNTLVREKTLPYPREGWGLASIPEPERNQVGGAVMVASDGTSNLYFLDDGMKTVRTLKVTLDNRPLRFLNELEWIDGKIWANVYTTDIIVVIDPVSGKVDLRIDCSSLIPLKERTPLMDVLNGIAYLPASKPSEKGAIFLTGKNWPGLFRVELKEKR